RRRPLVMGVLNVTPDSFSDGGRFASAEQAIGQAERMVADGADILDIGGESTRPGSQGVEAEEQLRRIVPVIRSIAKRLPVLLSVDTASSQVAAGALDAGADLINDISGGRGDAEMLPLAARRNVPIVLMHMQGTPATMQQSPSYGDVVQEVKDFLADQIRVARTTGIAEHRVLIDPGIGFGKTMGHNLELMRRTREFTSLGRPLVLGTSRKGFIGTITEEPVPAERLFGTAASVAWSVANGAAVVRVHDVRPMRQVVRMIRAIQRGFPESRGA